MEPSASGRWQNFSAPDRRDSDEFTATIGADLRGRADRNLLDFGPGVGRSFVTEAHTVGNKDKGKKEKKKPKQTDKK